MSAKWRFCGVRLRQGYRGTGFAGRWFWPRKGVGDYTK